MKILRCGNTNTCFLKGGLLIDTDYAGTFQRFCRAIKANGIRMTDIRFVLATHYHPDHIGLIGTLMQQNIGLLMTDTQCGHVHDSDAIFARNRHLSFVPIDESKATVIRCEESRAFLREMGISGEIISTPSHSPDSISVILDDGTCIVGDLEPLSYLAAYESNPALESDWNRILRCAPKRIIHAHANAVLLDRFSAP